MAILIAISSNAITTVNGIISILVDERCWNISSASELRTQLRKCLFRPWRCNGKRRAFAGKNVGNSTSFILLIKQAEWSYMTDKIPCSSGISLLLQGIYLCYKPLFDCWNSPQVTVLRSVRNSGFRASMSRGRQIYLTRSFRFFQTIRCRGQTLPLAVMSWMFIMAMFSSNMAQFWMPNQMKSHILPLEKKAKSNAIKTMVMSSLPILPKTKR